MPLDVLDGVVKWYVGKPPTCALWGLFSCPPPPREFRRPSVHLLPSIPPEPGLYSHTPGSGLWFAFVPGIPSGVSGSPGPRIISGGGGGQVVWEVGRLGASSAEGGGEVGARLPVTPFPVVLVDCRHAPTCRPSRCPGRGCSSHPVWGAHPDKMGWHLLLICSKACGS